MGTKKKALTTDVSAGLSVLSEMVPAYESATFGSVAPSDYRWPFARFAAWSREIFESGDASKVSPGEVLLTFLVGCKRMGWAVGDVLQDAAAVASSAIAADHDAQAAAATSEGMPDAK